MRRVGVVLCVLMFGATAGAGPSQKIDPVLEKQFRADVEAMSSAAATAWDEGNIAREAGRFDDAALAYRKAIALAPKSDHLHRRLCGILAGTNRIDDAVRECELALSLAPASAYNKAALAKLLFARGQSSDRTRAAVLVHEAAQALPNDTDIARLDCAARSMTFDPDDTAACVEHLLQLAPEDLFANTLATRNELLRGNYELARFHLEVAKRAGLPPAAYDELSERITAATKGTEFPISLDEALAVGIPVLLGWLGALVLLLVLGQMLSTAVLRGAGHIAADDPIGTPRERRLRRAYRSVLVLTGLLFYLSLPLLIFVVIAGAVIALALFDEMGGIPIFALIIIVMVVATTVISVLRALFFKPDSNIEGRKLEPGTFPKLGALLEETADAIGTRRVDEVYLVPGTDVGVSEHSSLRRAVFGGRSTRVLAIGVGLFDGMKQRELRAILAHEYGHFRNADTGGMRALAVKDSLVTLLRGIGESGYASFNPAWWLLRAFTHLYLTVSSGASRLQELLADRWAIRAYGSDAFVRGLRHTVVREVEFVADLSQTIDDVVDNKWSLPNLYEYDVVRTQPASVLEAEIEKRMGSPTQFDSHPPARQRIEWAEKVALPGDRPCPDGDEPVWALFPEPEKIERDMTAIIRERVRVKLGVTISDEEWDDADAPASADVAASER